MPLRKGESFMMCSCPKCAAEIELDIASISEEGSYTPCPECKGRFWLGKESFARRALKKEGQIYCDACGKELDCLIVCTACGVVFPDYCLLQASKPASRQLVKSEFSWSFAAKPAKKAKQAYAIPHKSTSVTPLSRKLLVRAVCLLVFAALAVVGVTFYNQKKAERQYATNYVLALYGIKSGIDLSLSQGTRLSADWKTKTDAGQRFVPHLTPQEESRSDRLKAELDPIMQKLDKAPQKFGKAYEQIGKLYGIHMRLNALVATPPGSLSVFTDSAGKLGNDFKSAAQELKAGLPKELSEELLNASTKYRELRDL
jgi:uncharacterized protein YbaR (Trm112 family)